MERSEIRPILLVCAVASSLLAWQAAPAAASESALNANWRGAWVLIGTEAYSGCGGSFTNNVVRGRRVQSKGEYRFDTGELGTVYKINLKRKRVDVLVEVAEPLRVARREGPFTLYDHLPCKIELQIELPRSSADRSGETGRLIADLLERHENRESAEDSEGWNGRLREPFPDDYDETLYEYERWRAEQLNANISARIDATIEDAARLIDRFDDDPNYLAGFAAGVDRARDHYFGDSCERLLSRSIAAFVDEASREEHRSWREGYEDGQALVFHLEIGRRLKHCFVPPPPP